MCDKVTEMCSKPHVTIIDWSSHAQYGICLLQFNVLI